MSSGPPAVRAIVPAGRTMRGVGLVLLVTGFVSGISLRFATLDADLFWLGFVPIPLILGGALLLYRGKQRAAAARSDAAGTLVDETAPVVYLRPFAADASAWGEILSALLTARMFTPVLSEEEQLAEAVAPIGPLIGIGQPGESRPKPGAVRVYPARWQERVQELLGRARLVILRPGTSEGVLWEVEQTFRTASPERVVLLLERLKSEPYERLRTAVADECGVELPPFRDVRRGRRARALVQFGPDWRAHVLPLRVPFWRVGVSRPMTHVFRHSLAPVFQRLGVPWQPSPVSTAKVIMAGVLGIVAVGVVALIATALLSTRTDYTYVPVSGSTPETPGGTSTEKPAEPAAAPPADPAPQLVAGLQISARGTPQPNDVELPAEQRGNFVSFESYQWVDGQVELSVTRFEARPAIAISVDGAVKGSLGGLATTKGVADFESNTSESTVSGQRAIRTSASYTMSGQAFRAEGVTVAVGQTVWIVMAYAPQTEDIGTLVRIITSVALSDAAVR